MAMTENATRRSLSVVVPVYNGALSIGALVQQVVSRYRESYDLEVVLVNDGSPDGSALCCEELVELWAPHVRFVDLARNFGEHNAVLAGLQHSRGDCAVIIDDDFQNPVSEIGKLADALVAGDFEVVYSRYPSKKHSLFRNLGSWFNGRVATAMLKKPADLYLSSFKAMSRFLIDEVCTYKGPFPYLDGLILRVTRNYGVVDCEHNARAHGRSNYTLRKLVSLWLNMFTNFSIWPLRAAMVLGLALGAVGGLLAVAVVAERMLYPETQMGWASIMVAILLFSGIQLLVLGTVGEYLGRLFLSDNQTPQFVVRRCLGFEDAPANS